MSEEALALAANSGASPNSLDAETVELVKTKLINGGIFLKHAAAASFIGKKSKYRSVWCAPSLKVIQWGEMDKKKHSGSMLVSDLRRVLVGNISETFKKLGKSVKNPNVCFSLQDSNRTLDLECVSQADRDMWVMCFKFLLPNNEDADAELAADEKMVEDNAPGKSKEQIAMERKAAMEKRKSVGLIQGLKDRIKELEMLLFAAKSEQKTENDMTMPNTVSELREALSQQRAENRVLKLESLNMKREVTRLQEEILFMKRLMIQDLPDAVREEYRMKEEKTTLLVTELQLSKVREFLKFSKSREEYLSRLGALDPIEVPIALIPTPDPDAESSSDEEEEVDDKGGKRGPAAVDGPLVPVLSAAELAKDIDRTSRNIRELLRTRVVVINGVRFEPDPKKSDAEIVGNILNKLARAIHRNSDGRCSKSGARTVAMTLLDDVNKTQLAGDCYAAVEWISGHPELAIIMPESSQGDAEPDLRFELDEEGVFLLSTHPYLICDAQFLMQAPDKKNIPEAIWSVCMPTFVKKTSYFGDDSIKYVDVSFTMTSHLKASGSVAHIAFDEVREKIYGSEIDMRDLHKTHNSLSLQFEKCQYLEYLSRFHIFHQIPISHKLDAPESQDYRMYLDDLHAFLFQFYMRVYPLAQINKLVAKMEEKFQQMWDNKQISGWNLPPSLSEGEEDEEEDRKGHSDDNEDGRDGIEEDTKFFCKICNRSFRTNAMRDAHFSSKKHQQRLERMHEEDDRRVLGVSAADIALDPVAAHAVMERNQLKKDVAFLEFKIGYLAELLREHIIGSQYSAKKNQYAGGRRDSTGRILGASQMAAVSLAAKRQKRLDKIRAAGLGDDISSDDGEGDGDEDSKDAESIGKAEYVEVWDSTQHTDSEMSEIREHEKKKVFASSSSSQRSAEVYLICNSWFKQWTRFVAGVEKRRPGPIQNDFLFLPNTNSPKPDLVMNKDYRGIDKAMWNMFFELYGGGPVIKRFSGNIYNS